MGRPHMRRWVRRGLLALVYGPAVVLLLTGAAAAVGVLGDLWRLAHALTTHALDSVPTTYDRLALSGRVALVSGAFLVVLCALVVVAVGCRGRRWWRLYLIPGVPLSAAACLLFIFAVQWCRLGVDQRLGWSSGVWQTLTVLALVDAVLVAARVGGIGAGPLGTRRARLRGRLRTGHTAPHTTGRPVSRRSRETQPIPVVRFGPRVTGVPASDPPAEASVPGTPGTPNTPDAIGAPTADELRAAADPAHVTEPVPVASEPRGSAEERAENAESKDGHLNDAELLLPRE